MKKQKALPLFQKEDGKPNLGKETEFLEFKESTGELDQAMKDISAILNKRGRGILYFGVKDNGDIRGFDIGEDTQRDISRRIYERIKPQIFPTIEEISGRKIIKVSFEGSDRPYSADGRYYLRVSDESREMSPSELARMILDTNRKGWERQRSETTIDCVDEVFLRRFLELSIACKRLPPMEYDKLGLLKKLHLLCEDGVHLNNAGNILFSSNEPVMLKMAVFATNEKRTFVDISPIKGNIFALIDEAEKYVKKNMHWKAVIHGFKRLDVPEIPVGALREIIINSFAHADYFGSSKHEIDLFPNRISIYNPGVFPDDLSPEDFSNKTIASRVRNELICDVLYKCGYVETWGTGIAKTYFLCKEKGIRCDYEKEGEGFWFIFRRNSTNDVPDGTQNGTQNGTQSVTKNSDGVNQKLVNGTQSGTQNGTQSGTQNGTGRTPPLTELERIVLDVITSRPTISRDYMAEDLGRGVRTIQRALDALKTKGIIRRVGGAKGYWEIVWRNDM